MVPQWTEERRGRQPGTIGPMDRARLISIVRTALPVWLVALVIVGSCEILTRYGLGDDARWQYWNRTMAMKVELVQRLGEC